MPYWPQVWVPPHAITTGSELGIGPWVIGTSSAGVVGASNRALACPIIIPAPVRAKRIFTRNGSTVSGNIDLGIYRHDLTKIISTGSTAQSGTSTLQFIDITDTDLPAGNYYLAYSIDNNTGQIGTVTPFSGLMARMTGAFQMASAFALPTTLTPAAATAVPFIGIEVGRIV